MFKCIILSRNLIQIKVQNNIQTLHCHIKSTFYCINSSFKVHFKRENLIRLKTQWMEGKKLLTPHFLDLVCQVWPSIPKMEQTLSCLNCLFSTGVVGLWQSTRKDGKHLKQNYSTTHRINQVAYVKLMCIRY